jgi:hypothetical protein
MNTTRQEPTMTDRAMLAIDYHAAQAAYSATVTDRVQLRARILRRARQARLSAAWGLRGSTGTRSAS